MNEDFQKKKTGVVIAVVVALIIVVALGAWLIAKHSDNDDVSNTSSNTTMNSNNSAGAPTNTTATREVPSGMKLYTNNDYGFTALYPETWPVEVKVANTKFGTVDATSISMHLYRPDIKQDEGICGMVFMKKEASQSVQAFLDAHFSRPSQTSWSTERGNFAGGMNATVLSNFDDLGSIGDLVAVGPYFESPDKQYVVYPQYSQEKSAYLTDIFGGTTYTCDDLLNSVRWN